MMASCECCREDACRRVEQTGEPLTDLYQEMLKEHKALGCICTQKNPVGDRARAGQFWVNGRDTRKEGEQP